MRRTFAVALAICLGCTACIPEPWSPWSLGTAPELSKLIGIDVGARTPDARVLYYQPDFTMRKYTAYGRITISASDYTSFVQAMDSRWKLGCRLSVSGLPINAFVFEATLASQPEWWKPDLNPPHVKTGWLTDDGRILLLYEAASQNLYIYIDAGWGFGCSK